ncbi:MAG: DUF3634 family protein [Candidatus Sedimenticola sp. (ex Thyasira tokunagai)]
MEHFILFALMIFVLWILGTKLYFGKHFVIRISPGLVTVKKGEPPKVFLKDCRLIIRHQIIRGYIYGIRNHDGIKLEFSSSIDPGTQQKIRNIFPFAKFTQKNTPDGTTEGHTIRKVKS